MCNCIAEMNAKLQEHNGGIVHTMFLHPARAVVEVYRLKTGRGTRRPPKVIASFCPFCGDEYGSAEGVAAPVSHAIREAI